MGKTSLKAALNFKKLFNTRCTTKDLENSLIPLHLRKNGVITYPEIQLLTK